MPTFLTFLTTLTLLAGASSAQTITRAELDALLAPAVEAEWLAALSIGVIEGEHTLVAGFGQVSETHPHAPDGETLYEIGSVSKVFTGVLLGDAIARGEVRLEQPIAELLPEGIALAPPGDAITLHDLSTHSSGLQRMPPGFDFSDFDHDWLRYDRAGLYAAIDGHEPGPRGSYAYSNLAVGLLGTLLGDAADSDYETLLLERLCAPMELPSTKLSLSADETARLAAPHDPNLSPALSWDLAALSPAGGIRSSVNEMLRFAQIVIEPDAYDLPNTLREGLRTSLLPRRTAGFGGHRVGLGWHMNPRAGVWWHNGQTGGYHAMLEIAPEEGLAVVVLSADAGAYGEQIAEYLMARLLGVEAKAPSVPTSSAPPTPGELAAYIGRYASSGGGLTVTEHEGQLHAQLTGQESYRLWPLGSGRFRYRLVEAELQFVEPADGATPRVEIFQNGTRLDFTRFEESEALHQEG